MEARARFIAVSRKAFWALGLLALVLAAVMAGVVGLELLRWLPGSAAAGVLVYVSFYSVVPVGAVGCLLLYYSRRLS